MLAGIKCKHCGSTNIHAELWNDKPGIFCDECKLLICWISPQQYQEIQGNMIQNVNKEAETVEYNKLIILNDVQYMRCDIPIGSLCCFKQFGDTSDSIWFGYMVGMVVTDFESLSTLYILTCDGRYFFSNRCIIKPDDVETANDAIKYFS